MIRLKPFKGTFASSQQPFFIWLLVFICQLAYMNEEEYIKTWSWRVCPKGKLIDGISYLPNIDLDLGTYLGGSSWREARN